MECPLRQSYLERLPKDDPYQICRFCVKETNDLLNTRHVSDFRILYLNLMNVEYSPGHEHPTLVCTSCMDMLRKITAFMGILYEVDNFWKAYDKANTVPVASPCDIIEIKKEDDDQPSTYAEEHNIISVFESTLTVENNTKLQATIEPDVGKPKDFVPEIEKKEDIKPAILEIKKKKSDKANCNAHLICTKKLSSKKTINKNLTLKGQNIKPLLSVACGYSPPKRKKNVQQLICLPHVAPLARPFKCFICGETYQSSLNLSMHLMMMHSCARPFS